MFADPFRFDVARQPNPHLAFGNGLHHCLGASLARSEIRLIFEELLPRWSELELAGPVEWGRAATSTAASGIFRSVSRKGAMTSA